MGYGKVLVPQTFRSEDEMDYLASQLNECLKLKGLTKYYGLLPGFIHNINTPLMSISGRIELIQFKHPEISGVTQMLEQLERLNGIVDNLKYMIEMDKEMEPQEIKLDKFFIELDRFLHLNLTYKHKIKLSSEITPSLSLFTRPFNLLNVMYEVLNHCIISMPSGGDIKLEATRDSGKIKIVVMRTGDSISMEQTQKLEQNNPDLELNQPYTGLIAAKLLIKKIGGKLTISSNSSTTNYHIEL